MLLLNYYNPKYEKEIETRFLNINKDEFVKNLFRLALLIKAKKTGRVNFYDQEMSWKGKGKFVRLEELKINTIDL